MFVEISNLDGASSAPQKTVHNAVTPLTFTQKEIYS